MKILITTDWYRPVINGVVTSVLNLTEQLEKRGHEVKVLTLSRNCHSYKEENVIYAGSVGMGKIYPQARVKIPVVAREYMEELLAWKPDLIHSQCEFSTFFLAKRIAGELDIPIIHTYHTVYEDYTHYFSPQKAWGRSLVQMMTRKLSDQVDAMIAPSGKIERILEGYRVSCPVNVVPSGIDTEKYRKRIDDRSKEALRKQYGIKEDEIVFVYVGRMAKEKNIEELLWYQKSVQKNIKLVLVGDGPYRTTLEEKAKEYQVTDSVIFTGMVSPDEVDRYYQIGDLFVSASTSETQGMTYDEALAGGVPLLCRKDDCLKEVVTEGKNGWQYENESMYLECIQKWKEFSEDEKRRMRNTAVRTADQFSKESFAKRVERVYLAALEERKDGMSMQLNDRNQMAKIWNLVSLAGLLICVALAFWAYKNGILDSVDTLQAFIAKFGYGGMAIFVLIQIVQVVIPILPGGISCLGGVIFFGPWLGFVYNYIGICIGSLAAFGISRMMGRPVLHKMFSEKLIQKYDSWTEKDSRFLKLFTLAIFFPVAPDDFLCYLAGTTKMTWKQFSLVILLGKPCSIALYSLGLTTAFRMIFSV